MADNRWGAFEWLRRWGVLPKGRNSVSDILGTDGAQALKERGWEILEREIRRIFERIGPLHQAQEFVWQAVSQALKLGRLPESERELVRKVIEDCFRGADPAALIEERLLAELRKLLKV